MYQDDEPEEVVEPTADEQEQPAPVKAKKKEKPDVAKKAAKGKGGRKKAASANGKTKAGRASRISDDAKIIQAAKTNPFREGTDSYNRVEGVWKNSGQSAGTIKKKVELLPGSLSHMVKLGLIRVQG